MLHCRRVKLRLQLSSCIDQGSGARQAKHKKHTMPSGRLNSRAAGAARTNARAYSSRWVRLLSASVGAAQRAAGVLHVFGGKWHPHTARLVLQSYLAPWVRSRGVREAP